MGRITVGKENSAAIELYYEDLGSGRPIVLLHGWPFDSRSWEPQLPPLLDAGYRVINYDRRGFGRSSAPAVGYDFDSLSGDLDTVMRTLDVHDATIIGFSLGTGELARYIGRFGTGRLRSAVFIESLTPTFAKGPSNPDGVDAAAVGAVQEAIRADRYTWLTGMMDNFLNLDQYRGTRVSDDTVRAMWSAGTDASPWATWACPQGWLEDFSDDVKHVDVPALIIHGTADRILPVEAQGHRARDAMADAQYIEIEGGPHIHPVTHAPEVNDALLRFLAR